MSPLARPLLALAAAALLHAACAAHRRNHRSGGDVSVSLGIVNGTDVVNLPLLHIGIPDVIVTLPNDCNPNGYIPKLLTGSAVIVRNVEGGLPPILKAVNLNDPQSDVEVHCQVEIDEVTLEPYRCRLGLDVNVYQFCKDLIL